MRFNLNFLFFFFAFAMSSLSAWATHNRAGEITYEHVSGFTYRVTITTCTKTNVIADRPWLNIDWGDLGVDAELDSLERQLPIQFLSNNAQINTYEGVHTYAGPGIFEISVLDPNRNSGVLNMPGSVNQPFCVRSTLIINPQTGQNNSVQLLNPPKEEACLNKRWIHNPGAYDPDGDLLVYSLVDCLGDSCNPIAGYERPDVFTDANDTFVIDAQTGDVTWEFPPLVGEYNIAILIEEFREVNGVLIKVGDVIRDMQITVQLCINNPPEIEAIEELCVLAGTSVSIEVNAADPDGDPVVLTAIGGPLTETDNLANFTNPSSGLGTFSWLPQCEEVRPAPYQVLFRAEDSGNQIPLVDLESWFITVVAPPVENPLAEPNGNTFELSWDVSPCIDAFSEAQQTLGSYKIYRRFGEYGFEPEECELGVPEYTGYQFLSEVSDLNSTSFIDEDVFFGGNYCYMVVTCFPNESISMASEEFCGVLAKTGPVITNASVESTAENGEVSLAWSPPTEIDLENFPGPYHYKLFTVSDFTGAQDLILETPDQLSLDNPDTLFNHSAVNTIDNPNAYRVELYSGKDLVQSSATASSIFLELIPDDNEITIVMNLSVPWQNLSYEVFRFNNDLAIFESIGTTTDPVFVDEGLTNNVEYCYLVTSTGTYGESSINDPLINNSQEVCGQAIDFTPPCAPTLSIDDNCEIEINTLTWNNPNSTCADDVIEYNIYYAATQEEELQLLTTIDLDTDTTFVFNELGDLGTIAGCFAVSALDSLLVYDNGFVNQNESELSNVICVDNCPVYELPNVFTPNNDGSNDLFVPFPYRFVESIDLKIFNRWGTCVFETKDPAVLWDGRDKDSNDSVSDGTYFYTVTVNNVRLSGIESLEQSGFIQVLGAENQTTN